MFKLIMGAVILTLCMVTMAALLAFLLLVYSRMKDDLDNFRTEKTELEERLRKLSAENFALRIGNAKKDEK